MEELSYDTVSTVIESWEALRRKKDFAEIMGRGLLIRFFLERPDAKLVFGFDSESESSSRRSSMSNSTVSNSSGDDSHTHGDEIDIDIEEVTLYKSEKFLEVAKNFVNFVNQAVDMLGPDLETLTEIFVDLATKHHLKQYDLPPKFYPVLGRGLLGQLEEMLGPKVFLIHTRACWLKVFKAISLDMTSPSPSNENCKDLSDELHSMTISPRMFKRRLKLRKKKPI